MLVFTQELQKFYSKNCLKYSYIFFLCIAVAKTSAEIKTAGAQEKEDEYVYNCYRNFYLTLNMILICFANLID